MDGAGGPGLLSERAAVGHPQKGCPFFRPTPWDADADSFDCATWLWYARGLSVGWSGHDGFRGY
jgi:hypothetical protein